jgi:hypothetical protein
MEALIPFTDREAMTLFTAMVPFMEVMATIHYLEELQEILLMVELEKIL